MIKNTLMIATISMSAAAVIAATTHQGGAARAHKSGANRKSHASPRHSYRGRTCAR